MNLQYEEHCEFTYSSDTDWDRAEAQELGELNPECAWVCTDRDVWHANPYYKGPAQPHPEEEDHVGFDYGIWWLFELESHYPVRRRVYTGNDDCPF